MDTIPNAPAHNKSAEPETLNISQAASGLRKVNVMADWSFVPHGGKPMDVDLTCFILGKDGLTREDGDFVFYNNPQGGDLAVKLLGGSAPGEENSSPESLNTSMISVDFENLSFDVWRVVFVLAIYQGAENDQSFDVLREGVLRIENADSKEEIVRCSFDASTMAEASAIRIAELTRDGVEWNYWALKDPIPEGLGKIARDYGILVSSN